MLKKLSHQVGVGLCLAFLTMAIVSVVPAKSVASDMPMKCQIECCFRVGGWCVWGGCIRCYRDDFYTQ